MTSPRAVTLAALLTVALGAAGCGSGGHRAPAAGAGSATTPSAAVLHVESSDVATGRALSPEQMAAGVGGHDVSPQLSWSGAPETTKSFAVTVFDRDAGGGRGYWHWAVVDIPATTTGLPSGAGNPDGASLPPGTRQLPGSSGFAGYSGAAPPAGTGTHHYVITVSALDLPTLPLPSSATAGDAESIIQSHTLARGEIIPVAAG